MHIDIYADIEIPRVKPSPPPSQARGDRPTALLSPESDAWGEQRLGVTRALGDFYMQTRGVTHEPSVSCIGEYEQALVCLSNREIVNASRGCTFHCKMAKSVA